MSFKSFKTFGCVMSFKSFRSFGSFMLFKSLMSLVFESFQSFESLSLSSLLAVQGLFAYLRAAQAGKQTFPISARKRANTRFIVCLLARQISSFSEKKTVFGRKKRKLGLIYFHPLGKNKTIILLSQR